MIPSEDWSVGRGVGRVKEVGRRMARAASRWAWAKTAKVERIRAVPLFSECSAEELEVLAREARELRLPPESTLTSEGERGEELYVIVEGTAEVRKHDRTINRLGPGDFVGEIALFTGARHTATVTTTSHAHLLVLDRPAFHHLIEHMPSVRRGILKTLSERLQADAS